MLPGLIRRQKTLDVNIHDTYFVIEYLQLAILLSLVFAIMGVGYWIFLKTNTPLSQLLVKIHLLITIIAPLIALIVSQFYKELDTSQGFQRMVYVTDFNQSVFMISAIFIFIGIVGQLLYPINLSVGLIKRIKSSS